MTDSFANHPVTALMVEDQSDLRAAIEAALSMFGIKVSGVGSAAEFRSNLRAHRFDLTIVDLGLPDSDGLSLVRELTETPDGPGVIILTAASETEDRIKGFASGADLYFTKPVDCRELAVAGIRLAQRLRKAPSFDPPAASAQRATASWTLQPARWMLESPAGIAVNLTTKEMAFMETLASANATVERSQILLRLGYQDDDGGNRSLDALVRRLRIKAEEALEGGLPIRTVHGIGYIFSAPLKST
ncbi:MAG TPA: response regulator transcription factor [Magnetospirillaceae bacterium]|jgi:DNA-binding response OmpR family regulator